MKFNRDHFFSAYQQHFGKANSTQSVGLNRLLAGYERYYGWWDSIPQIANSLAQIKWETAHSFHPVVEGYYLGDARAANFYVGNTDYVKKFQRSLRYYPHFGRGDIQLTWEENYREQDVYLRKYFPEVVGEFEARTGQKFDLIRHPEQVLDGWISFCVMTVGMHKGTFREGQTLDRYINAGQADHYAARNIVNGDAGKKINGVKIGNSIANIAKLFETILEHALESDSELTAANIGEQFDRIAPNAANASTAGSLPAVSYPDQSAGHLPTTPSGDSQQSEPEPKPNTEPNQNPYPGAESIREITETVELPTAGGGKKTVEQSALTLPGDAPTVPPRTWFNVEDWKPWVFGKLKTTGKSFAGFNLSQGTANTVAAFRSGEYWYVPILIGLGLFLLSLLIAAAIALVLLGLWYFNRKEIKEYKTLELSARNDPSKYNFGLKFQKIGASVRDAARPLLGGGEEEK